jgi:hypothetical protein
VNGTKTNALDKPIDCVLEAQAQEREGPTKDYLVVVMDAKVQSVNTNDEKPDKNGNLYAPMLNSEKQ